VLRIERCRIAYFDYALAVTLKTDHPRPYTSSIVPGGLFINNCIFQAFDTCINLEHCTQNRIYANWFVGSPGVAIRLENCNKTWIVANEINSFKRAAILLEDDGKGGSLHDVVISLNWSLSLQPDAQHIEFINPGGMNNLMIADNIFRGRATMDMTAIRRDRGVLFHGNGGAGRASENGGQVTISSGQQRLTVRHRLLGIPKSIQLTPLQNTPVHWIENRTKDSFDIMLASPASEDISLLWRAAVQ